MIPTKDGGALLGVYSRSVVVAASGMQEAVSKARCQMPKASDNFGEDDYWIIKLNKEGKAEWEKNFGGKIKQIIIYYLRLNYLLLALWSGNGHIYDIKANKKIAPQGSYTAFEYNGGSYAITEGAIPTMTTARAIGNIIFGKNMRTIYDRNKTLGGDTPSQFCNSVMHVVGFYNQFGVDKPFNEGLPYYGEHTLSGTYIYGGFFRKYK